VDPMDLFNVQFQLAFICITALLLLGPPLVRWLVYRDRHDHDILLPIPQSAWWKAWTMLRAWLAISLIFWIASVPLVSLYFGQMSPWAIPAAIVFFPIVAAALFGGFAKILLTLAWPSLAGFWAGIAVGPVIIMRHALALLTHLPAIAIPVAQPSLHGIVFYYLLLASSIFPWPRKGLRRASVAVAAAAVCCFVASLTLGFPRAALPRSDEGLSITFLDIGAGQSAVVQAPGASPAMIDAGSSTISDVTRTVLGPFLSQRGERSLGDILLSHSDYDHISAVSAALPTFGIGTVYTSHYFAHFASIDPPAQSLLDELHQAQKSPHLIERGDHVELSHGVLIDVLWPPPNCDFNCNNTGLVLRLNFAGRRVLFPADIQVDAMRELLKSPAQLKADVLVAAHHGSSEVTTADFVAAVNPQFIISSNGSPLTEKQKHFERMIGGRPLYRTSNCGAITLHIGRDGTMSVETFLPGKR
jgi:competence protein ComEC